jgi:pimeloyl-ACP methyl ester carboxylesterase
MNPDPAALAVAAVQLASARRTQMAWVARSILLLGLLAALLLGFWLDPHLWPSRYRICGLLLAVVLLMSVQPVLIGCLFVAARLAGGELEPHERLDLLAALKMFDREIDASLRGIMWANPFRFGATLPKPQQDTRDTALLFIHGYFCNRSVWLPAARKAAQLGYFCEAVTLEPVFGSIEEYSGQIGDEVTALYQRSGQKRIVMVAHSMGALAARNYLERSGDARVERLICLGAPHQGTLTAAFGRSRNTHQIRRDSLWLINLNARTGYPRERIVSIFSVHDDIVFPYSTSELEGADNRRLFGIGHVSLLYHPDVHQLIFSCVDP